jgi:hypothetical protein
MHPANHPHKKTSPHKERIAAYMQRYPGFRVKNGFLGIFFVIGLVLIILSTILFETIFIAGPWLVAIAIVIGIVMTPLFRRFFNIYFYNPYDLGHVPLFFHVLYHSVAFGGTLIFLLLLTNKQLAHPASQIVTLPVISNGYSYSSPGSSCRNAYVVVRYDGMEKDLPCECGAPVETAHAVRLDIRKGFWGFDVITAQALVNAQ